MELLGFFGFGKRTPEDKIEQLRKQLEAAETNRATVKKDNEAKLAELDTLIEKIKKELAEARAIVPAAEPTSSVTTVVPNQGGGARRSKKSRRRTLKNRRRK